MVCCLTSPLQTVFGTAIDWLKFDSARSVLVPKLSRWVDQKIADMLGEHEQSMVRHVFQPLEVFYLTWDVIIIIMCSIGVRSRLRCGMREQQLMAVSRSRHSVQLWIPIWSKIARAAKLQWALLLACDPQRADAPRRDSPGGSRICSLQVLLL